MRPTRRDGPNVSTRVVTGHCQVMEEHGLRTGGQACVTDMVPWYVRETVYLLQETFGGNKRWCPKFRLEYIISPNP